MLSSGHATPRRTSVVPVPCRLQLLPALSVLARVPSAPVTTQLWTLVTDPALPSGFADMAPATHSRWRRNQRSPGLNRRSTGLGALNSDGPTSLTAHPA